MKDFPDGNDARRELAFKARKIGIRAGDHGGLRNDSGRKRMRAATMRGLVVARAVRRRVAVVRIPVPVFLVIGSVRLVPSRERFGSRHGGMSRDRGNEEVQERHRQFQSPTYGE